MTITELVDQLFRQESGKLVSVLTRIFGISSIELAEDVVQDTMVKALDEWPKKLPTQPTAWMYRVAKNRAIDLLRKNNRTISISPDIAPLLQSEFSLSYFVNQLFLQDEIKDSQLRMILAICHPALGDETQIALTLKTLGGLSTRQIASAFLTSEEVIQKRIYRARQKIIRENIQLEVPSGFELLRRLDNALKVVYLMFNEGYQSSYSDQIITKDICLEAMRLVKVLAEFPPTANNKTFSLLALMCFQVARFESRVNAGEIVLLPDQDRTLWNQELIDQGNYYLSLALDHQVTSSYFLEACIAAVHVNTSSYEKTNWLQIYQLYDELVKLKPSPIIKLHQLIALSEIKGAKIALEELLKLTELENYYLYHATKATLYTQQKCYAESKNSWYQALKMAKSPAERNLIKKRLAEVDSHLSAD